MLKLIAAVDAKWQIGFAGELLYSIAEDLKYFRQVTQGHCVLMGRKTFESIGKPLPNRKNIVLTRDVQFTAPDVMVCHTLEHAQQLLQQQDSFVIGGAQIYAQCLKHCEQAYITKIQDIAAQADSDFPNLDELPNWTLTEQSAVQHGLDRISGREVQYTFCQYMRQA